MNSTCAQKGSRKFNLPFKRRTKVLLAILLLTLLAFWSWLNIDTFEPNTSTLQLEEVNSTVKGNGYYKLLFDIDEFWYGDYKNSAGRSEFPDISLKIEQDFNVPTTINMLYSPTLFNTQDARTIIEKNETILERIKEAANSDRIQAPLYEEPFNETPSAAKNLRTAYFLLNFKIWLHLHQEEFKEAFDSSKHLILIGKKIIEGTSSTDTSTTAIWLIKEGMRLATVCSLVRNAPRDQIENTLNLISNLPNLSQHLVEDIKFDYFTLQQTLGYYSQVKSDSSVERKSLEVPDFIKESSLLPNETLTPVANFLSEFLLLFKEGKEIPRKLMSKLPKTDSYKIQTLKTMNRFLRGRNAGGKYILRGHFAHPASSHFLFIIDDYKCHLNLSKIKLALLLYYRDNRSLPSKLIDLTPMYLKEIPLDSHSNLDFVYSKGDRLVYSLGSSKKDSGGNKFNNKKQFYFSDTSYYKREYPIENPNFYLPERDIFEGSENRNPAIFLEFPGMEPISNQPTSE